MHRYRPERQRTESGDPVADARHVIRWAVETFGDAVCVTASFGDATLPHLVQTTVPGTEITLLDTGYLFAETGWFAEHVAERLGIRVRIERPSPELAPDVWKVDPDACCAGRKVAPLERVLRGHQAWITGLRRADSPTRRTAPIVHEDLLRSVLKVNPLAGWSDADVSAYAAEHDLPTHPLADRSYASIGCWPCTRPVVEGEDPRAGRWSGTAKTECGLHH